MDTLGVRINDDMKSYMDKLLAKYDTHDLNIKQYFNNELLEEFNKPYKSNSKKFNIDKYGLIYREDAYNTNSAFGWKIINGEAININVIDYIQTNINATNKEVFEYGISCQRLKKVSFSPKCIPTKIYRLLGIIIPDK